MGWRAVELASMISRDMGSGDGKEHHNDTICIPIPPPPSPVCDMYHAPIGLVQKQLGSSDELQVLSGVPQGSVLVPSYSCYISMTYQTACSPKFVSLQMILYLTVKGQDDNRKLQNDLVYCRNGNGSGI